MEVNGGQGRRSVGYRQRLSAQVHRLRSTIRAENEAAFRRDEAIRLERLEERREEVTHLIEVEFRAARAVRAREDAEARATEVEARRDHVATTIAEQRAERLETHQDEKEQRRTLLEKISADVDGAAAQNRQRMAAEEVARVATCRSDEARREREIADRRAYVDELKDEAEEDRRRLSSETQEACVELRRQRHRSLHAVFSWVDEFTGRYPERTI